MDLYTTYEQEHKNRVPCRMPRAENEYLWRVKITYKRTRERSEEWRSQTV